MLKCKQQLRVKYLCYTSKINMLKQTQLDDFFRNISNNKSSTKENYSHKRKRGFPKIKFEQTPTKVMEEADAVIISSDDDEFESSSSNRKLLTENVKNSVTIKGKWSSKTLKKKSTTSIETSPSKLQRCDTLQQVSNLANLRSNGNNNRPITLMSLNTPEKIKVNTATPSHLTSLSKRRLCFQQIDNCVPEINPGQSVLVEPESVSLTVKTTNELNQVVQKHSQEFNTENHISNSQSSSTTEILSDIEEPLSQSSKSSQNTVCNAASQVDGDDEYFSTDFITDVTVVVETNINLSQCSDRTENYDSDELEDQINDLRERLSDSNNGNDVVIGQNQNTERINNDNLSNAHENNTNITPVQNQREILNNDSRQESDRISTAQNKINVQSIEIIRTATNTNVTEKSRTQSHVARNLFSNDSPTKTICIQTNMDLEEHNVLLHNGKHNMGTQVRFQDIVNEINEMNKTTSDRQNQSQNKEIQKSLTSSLGSRTGTIELKTVEHQTVKNQTVEKVKKDEIKIDKKNDKRYSEENCERLCINVQKIGNWVLEHFGPLFSSEHIAIFHALLNLPNMLYKVFCLRLFTRQYKWYNVDDFCKILNLKLDSSERRQMVKLMVDKNILVTDYSQEEVPVLLKYLNNPQLKDLCKTSKLKNTPRKKDAMISALLVNASSQMTLSSLKKSKDVLRDNVSKKLGTCVKLSTAARDILHKIHMLYSIANPELETANDIYWLLNTIHFEKLKYPNFTVDDVEIFRTSRELDRFMEARILQMEFSNEILNKDNKHNCFMLCSEAYKRLKILLADVEQKEYDKEKPLYLRRYSASWVYCSVLSSGALNLGKFYPNEVCQWLNYLLKQKIYCPNKRGKWYEQLAMVKQSHLKDLYSAVEYIFDGLNDPLVSEVSQHELSIRASKIRRGKISDEKYNELHDLLLDGFDPFPNRTFQSNVVHDNAPGRKKSYVQNTETGKEYGSVEQVAILFYLNDNVYTNGIHCEGRLLSTLFCLLFWDIIYRHVPNTFISEIQKYPLDMFSGEFYRNRRSDIDKRLNDIENVWTMDTLCDFLSDIYKTHLEELHVLIPQTFGDVSDLATMVKCIGTRVLGAVFKRFAEDYRLYSAGLPDLFLWNPKEKRCSFVEVKGERDKLSTKQILWLNYLRAVGAKIEVCHIQDIGSRTARKPRNKSEDIN